jgi:GNAT superfamily N-acetyltransferase
MEYQVVYDIKTADFISIRKAVAWNEIKESQVTKALAGSMVNVSVFKDDKCIGIGRIVGDHALKGMLTDIMVDPSFQHKGVGKLIVTKLIEKLSSMISEGESFQLEASPTASNREFYLKCGLKYKPENQDGVYMWIKK